MLAALRDGREPAAVIPSATLFETVAEEVFDRYGRRWKPRTIDVNRATDVYNSPRAASAIRLFTDR